ncbi:MAG: anthranilate phosphoribosyltransferase [Candidatus Omnitrophota bacterium]|nr:anthranilate phosphoribosyltransferase [Candidatus Omnitrophota bacterium]
MQDIKEATEKLEKKIGLSDREMEAVFEEIMAGRAEKEGVKRFLISLAAKGESPEEIAAAARVMRKKATKVNIAPEGLIDTCGTGGAAFHDINISTIAAFVIAGCGIKVAKHGNRSFTGKCGSADILEALGVNINKNAEEVRVLIEKTGIAFLFAPNFHPAMKNVMEVRRELKMRTIFNLLGPLSNPAGVRMQILGVYKAELTEVMAEALKKLGSERAYVVYGLAGLDEISIEGETKVSELKDGKVSTYYIKPADFGIKEGSLNDIKGDLPSCNKEIVLRILKGEEKGTARSAVIINAAAALVVAGSAPDLKSGADMAGKSIDSGRALQKLNMLKDLSRDDSQ